jgi:zinc D-Ala-D-Ala carboxypeptidase
MPRLRAALAALARTTTGIVGVGAATSAPAHADECYSWSGSLAEGASGPEVAELQTRVAGWIGDGTNMAIDGQFGPQTTRAVQGFQSAHGLAADGVAGQATFEAIYELQNADCSTAHFSWAEVSQNCGAGGFAGGSVDEATVKENLERSMWRAEALRQRLGNHPLTVTDGFRSASCDVAVGGSGSGQHTYGNALDLVGHDFCSMAQTATTTGYGGILGPGFPDHDDHVHVDLRSPSYWSAPSCGV